MRLKFSIVTPVYNGAKFIAETIESVISQEGDFEIEYVVADGGSQDDTVAIVKNYIQKLESGQFPINCRHVSLILFSEKDKGMYDAIKKSFLKTSGEIMAYINADDFYLPNAFKITHKIFEKTQALWIKGKTDVVNENSQLLYHCSFNIYLRDWIPSGIYGTQLYVIQQDSVFWKRELWNKIDEMNSDLRLAGDFWLWTQFSKHSNLVSFDKAVSCFREREVQLSSDMQGYYEEMHRIGCKKLPAIDLIKVFLLRLLKKVLGKSMHKLVYESLFHGHEFEVVCLDSYTIKKIKS